MSSAATKRILRVLYRSALRRAQILERELQRAEMLRSREVEQLATILARHVCEETRVKIVEEQSDLNANVPGLIGTATRTLTTKGTESPRDLTDMGFAVIKHLGLRADALGKLVYMPSSEAITDGVKVQVESSFNGYERSRYLFKYQIRISNESEQTVTLLSRRWCIIDLDGRETMVEGPGVVGVFPTLKPKESYSYTSGTPLLTPLGTQYGKYTFKKADSILDVGIAPFALLTPSWEGNSSQSADSAHNRSRRSSRSLRRRKRTEGGAES